MNVILGGGDVGKTTVLEAIALLLSPSNTAVISEADYWARGSAQEFLIEAVMTLPDATGIGSQNTFTWPWAWNGKEAVAPSANGVDDLPNPDDPVYRVRVRGTTELELAWEVVSCRTFLERAVEMAEEPIARQRGNSAERVGSSNRWVAPGTIASRFRLRSNASACRFKSITAPSLPPTISHATRRCERAGSRSELHPAAGVCVTAPCGVKFRLRAGSGVGKAVE